MTVYRSLFSLCLLPAIFACSHSKIDMIPETLAPDLIRGEISTSSFPLRTFSLPKDRTIAHGNTLRIYLEGDGYAYIHAAQPSFNPTPKNPVALRLMLADPTDISKVYLGRPCHYIKPKQCTQKYWTSHRFAPEVVQATGEAIDDLKQEYGVDGIELVGYSGGGGLALLVAAERQDVRRIKTIAANLNTEAFTRYHRLTPMHGSLNPGEIEVGHIPQVHFGGEKDQVIPPELLYESAPRSDQSDVRIIEGITHQGVWVEHWPRMVKE